MLPWTGDYERANIAIKQSLHAADAGGVKEWAARTLDQWGLIDRPAAISFGEAQLSQWQRLGDRRSLAHLLHVLGRLYTDAGDYAQASLRLQESIALWDEVGINWNEWGGAGWAWLDLGHLARLSHDVSLAHDYYQRGLDIHKEAGVEEGVAAAQRFLGHIAYKDGDLGIALKQFKASLRTSRDEGGREGIAYVLAALAEIVHTHGHQTDAARLSGAANSLLYADELITVRPSERLDFDRFRAWLEMHRDSPGFSEAYSAGAFLHILEAVDLGLSISG